MGRPGRPSNSTEGMIFEETWCSKCARDTFNPETLNGKSCPVMMDMLCGKDRKEYYFDHITGMSSCYGFRKPIKRITDGSRIMPECQIKLFKDGI